MPSSHWQSIAEFPLSTRISSSIVRRMDHAPDRVTKAFAHRYRFERELGSGGMATVYLAHDLKHERRVALKVLNPDLLQ